MTDICPRDVFRGTSSEKGKFEDVLMDKELSNDIERAVYNWAISYAEENNITRRWDNKVFRKVYLNKCVSLCNNLNEESYVGNKYLKDKVIDGELSSKELVDLDPTQIYPDNWKYLIEKRNNTTKSSMEAPEATTDQFKCPRCKARE